LAAEAEARQKTRLYKEADLRVPDLPRSQKATMDLQASINNMDFQLQQQAATTISIKKQTVETLISKERESKEYRRAKKQLQIVQRPNAQSIQFVEGLGSMDLGNFENVIGDNVDFDPTIARHMEQKKQENAAKAKILEESKGRTSSFVACYKDYFSTMPKSIGIEYSRILRATSSPGEFSKVQLFQGW